MVNVGIIGTSYWVSPLQVCFFVIVAHCGFLHNVVNGAYFIAYCVNGIVSVRGLVLLWTT